MSIDYSNILKKEKAPEKFKEWMNFWDLGEVDNSDNEINLCIQNIKSDIFNKHSLQHLALNAQDRVEDLLNFISQSEVEVNSSKLFEYILKFEKAWSHFKTKAIIGDDEFYGMLLKRLSEIDAKVVESNSEEKE